MINYKISGSLKNLLLILISSFILLPEAIGLIVIFISFLYGLYFLRPSISEIRWKTFLPYILIPLIYFISVLFSNNTLPSLNYFNRTLLFLVMPIAIYPLFREDNQKKTVLILYSLFISALLKIIISLFKQEINYNTFWEFRINLQNITDIHGTYWGLFFGSIAIISFSKYLFSNSFRSHYILLGVLSFLFLFSVNSKMPLINTLIILLGLIVKKHTRIGLAYGTILVIVTLSLIYITPFTKQRYFSEVSSFVEKTNYPSGIYEINHENISSLSTRFSIYNCAFTSFLEKPFFGYGSGDVQNTLDECYGRLYNTDLYLVKKLNTHNQYLAILLNNGIFGLFIFSFFWCFLLRNTILNENLTGFSILSLFLLCMLTENLIDRHYGALIVTFFISTFASTKPITK